jgi:hypothetical protein
MALMLELFAPSISLATSTQIRYDSMLAAICPLMAGEHACLDGSHSFSSATFIKNGKIFCLKIPYVSLRVHM